MPLPGSYSAVPGDDSDDDTYHRDALLPTPVTASSGTNNTYPPPSPSGRVASLGAKSKGKGKAVEHAITNGQADLSANGRSGDSSMAGSPTGPAGMSFSVRFTDGSEDLLDIWVGERESVGQVKRRIRQLRRSLIVDGRPRRLRLIQLGRLLTDGTFLVPYTVQLLSRRAKLVQRESQPNSQALLQGLEAVGRELGVSVRNGSGEHERTEQQEDVKGKGKSRQNEWTDLKGTEAEEDKRVWLHCSVGEPMDDDEIAGEQDKVQTTQITPLQGFDRLRDAGISEEEISSMRAEFRRTHGASLEGNDDEHARALEDQWMEGLTGQNEAAAASEGLSHRYWTTMLQGVCVGFFVPFLPFFFFRSQVFSRTMSMSIVLGAFINVTFGLLRMFN